MFVPCICNKWKDSNIKEHKAKSQKPIRRGKVLDVCNSLKINNN